jgi:hypothetical protein
MPVFIYEQKTKHIQDIIESEEAKREGAITRSMGEFGNCVEQLSHSEECLMWQRYDASDCAVQEAEEANAYWKEASMLQKLPQLALNPLAANGLDMFAVLEREGCIRDLQ